MTYLGLNVLSEKWEAILKSMMEKKPSYSTFLADVIENEYSYKTEKARIARTKRAKIPEIFVLETFPLADSPGLTKKWFVSCMIL